MLGAIFQLETDIQASRPAWPQYWTGNHIHFMFPSMKDFEMFQFKEINNGTSFVGILRRHLAMRKVILYITSIVDHWTVNEATLFILKKTRKEVANFIWKQRYELSETTRANYFENKENTSFGKQRMSPLKPKHSGCIKRQTKYQPRH